MGEEKTHIEYTGTDLLNYFAGRLNAAEMHALEKAALDDPFLAEAMEGYSSLPAAEIKTRLTMLQNNFAGEETAKVIPFNPVKKAGSWKAAAAILIIAAGLALTYLFNSRNKPGDNSIAKMEKPEPQNEAVLPVPEDSVTADQLSGQLSKKDKATETIFPKKQVAASDSQFIYRPAKPANEKREEVSGGGYIADAETKAGAEASANNLEAYANRNAAQNAAAVNQAAAAQAKSEKTNARSTPLVKYNGQVLAADNTPLPFANVRVAGEDAGTYADARGNFKLVSPDSVIQVEIRSAGFITRNFTLKVDEMPGKIFLIPDDVALKDKTVISGKAVSANRSRRAVLQADTVMDARPADGWQNYDAYVTNNLEISNTIQQQKIHGEVEVSFDVLDAGTITNLKVDKSLCEDCDEEVLRLVKEGPKWKVTRGTTAKGRLRVKF